MKICLSCEGVTNAQAQRCGHCGAWLLPTEVVHYPVRRGEIDSGNPLLGTVIDGKYRLQSVLGRGGLGTVFSAVHIGSLMTVAVKLLHPRFTERPEYRRALLPEARRAATVTHARCARLLDAGEAEEGVAYLAMELVEGKTLDVLVRGGKLAPSHAVDVLLQVAEALEAIHAAGLVHCDLSPRNVIVAARGGELQVKVLDFGIARSVTLAGAGRARDIEFAGFVNPAFSAPELLAGGDVDPRADLYAFGTLAWLLLTGGLPIDDSDPRRAALAVAAGELRPWPAVVGVPRRLQRLVQRCLCRDREGRPPSATAVRQQLAVVRGARRPAIARTAVGVCAVGIIAVLAVGDDPTTPFLHPWPGSALHVADPTVASGELPQDLRSTNLDTLGFHFGGFDARRLRADVSQHGMVLLRAPLRPEVDADAGTLLLSTAQPEWREVVASLVTSCGEDPVDVSFVVPGAALLGTSRVRVDDEAPRLQAHLDAVEGGVLTARAQLVWQADDAVGLAEVATLVAFADGRQLRVPLSASSGTFELGAAIAVAVASVESLGGGEIVVLARDRAGNEGSTSPIRFHAADVAAPTVLEVTGPAGEAFVPCLGDKGRLRVRLSAPEAGCSLHLHTADGALLASIPLATAGQILEVPLAVPVSSLAALPIDFVVVDAFGNRTTRRDSIPWRERSLRLEFAPVGTAARWVGRELVLAEAGATVIASVGETYALARVALELTTAQGTRDAGPELRMTPSDERERRVEFGTLPPGSHVLHCELREAEGDSGLVVRHDVPVRVLPAIIDVRVPVSRTRFLPGLIEAGVLARRAGGGYGEGAGWRIDASLLAYLRGTLWVGTDTPVPLPLPPREATTEPLLPEVTPVPGHNVLAVDLRDVLDRPVRILAGDGLAEQRHHGGRALAVVADFWWHDGAPVPIGEELLGEHGQPVRLRLRFPLPFLPSELGNLRLSIAQSEIAASELTPAGGDGSAVLFELPFAIWSVAAQLADKSREEFAEQLQRSVEAKLETPAGHWQITLRVRTTRSTLQPFTLAELGGITGSLAAMRFLPVLAPAVPFKEPVPGTAPPRAVFRPQVAVAVHNFTDLLLQDREITCGEARALLEVLDAARQQAAERRFVHHDDPLGQARLLAENVLPASARTAAADEPLTGVTFYQAWTLCRLLGLAVANDPELFRLPLGCELELAAFAGADRPACHGVAAHGGAVAMKHFLAAAALLARGETPTATASRAAGDVVPTPYHVEFTGLDFGVREWVLDLPHLVGAELLMKEWIGDHGKHLARVVAMAEGLATPAPDPIGPLRTLGVVRGLALGELEGLVGASGTRLDPGAMESVPDTVPGVLRTEQLMRDGRDLLSMNLDPRLARTGFRVVCAAASLARLRGRR